MLLQEGLWRSVFFIMSGLVAAPLPILCNHRLVLTPCRVRLHTKHVSPLGSGHILPPAVRLRTPTSHHLHPLLLFFLFLVLLQSLLLPITPSFPWPETGDMWWQRCQHRSQWSSLLLFPLARESMHSSLFSFSINLLSVLSGSTFLPIKSFHCPALQGSGYTGL